MKSVEIIYPSCHLSCFLIDGVVINSRSLWKIICYFALDGAVINERNLLNNKIIYINLRLKLKVQTKSVSIATLFAPLIIVH